MELCDLHTARYGGRGRGREESTERFLPSFSKDSCSMSDGWVSPRSCFFLIIDFAAGGQICLFFKNIFKCIFIHYTGQKKTHKRLQELFYFCYANTIQTNVKFLIICLGIPVIGTQSNEHHSRTGTLLGFTEYGSEYSLVLYIHSKDIKVSSYNNAAKFNEGLFNV